MSRAAVDKFLALNNKMGGDQSKARMVLEKYSNVFQKENVNNTNISLYYDYSNTPLALTPTSSSGSTFGGREMSRTVFISKSSTVSDAVVHPFCPF